jgi:[ribosomal protein S5]-alanine N-acetyltransferase
MDFIRVNKRITISEITLKDVAAFVEYLNDKDIYINTLNIPHPYTKEDGERFVNIVAERKKENGKTTNWAIRNKNEKLIGGIGFHNVIDGHKAQIGYWLAKPYWEEGIMSEIVKKVSEIGFSKFKLRRITAHIFEYNRASSRVLEKNNFALEVSCAKNYYKKDGKIFNGKLYAKTN